MGGEVLTMADVTANLQAATTASTPYALPTNLPLLSAFLSFALAQFLKIFTSWCVRLSHFHHRVSFPLCLAHLSSVQSLFPSSVRSKHCDEKSARLSFFFFRIQHHTSFLDASVANILCFRRQFVFQTVYLVRNLVRFGF